jgi:8-oxo-dGTP diphosphatase
LAGYEIERILSSSLVRCVQTVEPLARELGIEIEERGELTEGATLEEALALVDEVRRAGVVLCTHGDVVLELLGAELKKGETAILAP